MIFKSRAGIRRCFWGPCLFKTHGKGWGLRPHPFPWVLRSQVGRLDPQKSALPLLWSRLYDYCIILQYTVLYYTTLYYTKPHSAVHTMLYAMRCTVLWTTRHSTPIPNKSAYNTVCGTVCDIGNCNARLTLCYAILFPGRKSGFRARFRPESNPDSSREVSKSVLRQGDGGRLGQFFVFHN